MKNVRATLPKSAWYPSGGTEHRHLLRFCRSNQHIRFAICVPFDHYGTPCAASIDFLDSSQLSSRSWRSSFTAHIAQR